MTKTGQHPFAGRKGSAARDHHAIALYMQQNGRCKMCGNAIPGSLRGKKGKRAAVVDHIRPWRMCPELAHDRGNLQLICRGCHHICESIEDQIGNNPDLIAEAKARASQNWG